MSDVVLKNFKCGGKRYCVGSEYDGPKEYVEELQSKNLLGPAKDLVKADAKLGKDPDELAKAREKNKKTRGEAEGRKEDRKTVKARERAEKAKAKEEAKAKKGKKSA